jgi:hypothetical protein
VHDCETTAAISTEASRASGHVYDVQCSVSEDNARSPELFGCFKRDDKFSPFGGLRSAHALLRKVKELNKPEKWRDPSAIFSERKLNSGKMYMAESMEAQSSRIATMEEEPEDSLIGEDREWEDLTPVEQERFVNLSFDEKRMYEKDVRLHSEWNKVANKASSSSRSNGGLCACEVDPITNNLHILLSDLTLPVGDEVELFLDIGCSETALSGADVQDELNADDICFKKFSTDELFDTVATLDEARTEDEEVADAVLAKILVAASALHKHVQTVKVGDSDDSSEAMGSMIDGGARLAADVKRMLAEVEALSKKRGVLQNVA